MTAALYHALIVEHDRAPHHERALAEATHSATLDNPLCGDRVTVHLQITDARIAALTFEARACALCRAAASMLAVRATGSSVAELQALSAQFTAFTEGAGEIEGDLAAFAGVQTTRSRRGCATLPFRAALAALVERG